MSESLELFGAFFVRNLRDKMLHDLENILGGKWKAPDLQELQHRAAGLSDAQKQVVRDVAEQIITGGMHDLLFALQEESDNEGPIRLVVDGEEVAKLSDGMHGEIFGAEGWIVRYSKYPSETEIESSRAADEQIKEMFDDNGQGKS